MSARELEVVASDNARETPVRLAFVQEDVRPAVDLHEDDMVMTFPHLVVREMITLVAASLAIVVVALVFDAPLEEIANPQKTPNPAKAPWYFLGLQELLHYYPPLISGVVLPGLVVVALAIVPYFDVNLSREPFWESNKEKKLLLVSASVAVLCGVFLFSGAHPVWPIIFPTLAIGGLVMWPGVMGTGTRWRQWLATRSLAFWVFSWFLVIAVVLTIIGVFFRGPGWTFTLPWRDGIYY